MVRKGTLLGEVIEVEVLLDMSPAAVNVVLSHGNPPPSNKQVIRVQKLVGLPPPHSNYLRVFLRFRRTFAEVITFGEASAHEFQPKFKLSAFEIGHLYFAQYKF